MTPEEISIAPEPWECLREKVEKLCLIEGDFILTSGERSPFYFDAKRAMLSGECLSLIADEFLRLINTLPYPPAVIGGLTMGADFIVAGVIQRAFAQGLHLSGSIVRKEPKEHGTRSRIENEFDNHPATVVVDDVFTTGSSTLKACTALTEFGYRVVGIIGLVDREQGGIDNLRRAYDVPVLSVFTKSDFPLPNSQARV